MSRTDKNHDSALLSVWILDTPLMLMVFAENYLNLLGNKLGQ